MKKIKELLGMNLPIIIFAFIPPIIVWLPFFLRTGVFWNIPLPKDGLATIVSNYDGPLYLVVAKTMYNIQAIKENFSFALPVEYYAAHFPLFPILIRVFATFINYGYAMLIVTLISTWVAFLYFYKLCREYLSQQDALWLLAVFSIFPARWLIVRSVGSPEPLFLACIVASLFYFKKEKYLYAGLFGALAQLTKSPGILLFITYALFIGFQEFEKIVKSRFNNWIKSIPWRMYPLLLMPLSLIAIFVGYSYTFHDFFAYFHSGDNIHIFFPPFQIFNYSAPWVNTHWLEEIIFVYAICIYGFLKLIKKQSDIIGWFVGVFLSSLLFVSHRDIVRYALPIVPFLFIAYSDIIVKKEFKILMVVLIIPIYLFALAFISKNVMPISDWSPLL